MDTPSIPLGGAAGSGRRSRSFIASEAHTRVGEGLSCCQYRNEIPQVPQQIRILTCSSNRLALARFALSAGEEAAEGKCQIEHSKGLPQPTLRFEVAIGLAFEMIPIAIDTSA